MIQLIPDRVDGDRCQMKDGVADSAGRLISGSWFYDANGNYPLGKLMPVDTDGRVTVLDDGFHLANGLDFSPDDRALYFTDSAARRIYAYDYNPLLVTRGTEGLSSECRMTRVFPMS
jgi:sugar lactone lactonase YvrE